MGDVDEIFDDLLEQNNSMGTEDLAQYIKKAREAETKAKMQIYTMKGKKSLEKLNIEMEDESVSEVNNEATTTKEIQKSSNNEEGEDDSFLHSAKFEELRKQIEHYRELERMELENIERLKKERELQQLFNNVEKQEIQSVENGNKEEIRAVSVQSSTATERSVVEENAISIPNFLSEPAPLPAISQSNSSPSVPSIQSQNASSSSSLVSSDVLLSPRSTRKSKGVEAPSSFLVKTISIAWDNAPKSKKNNKTYTLSISMFGKSWKVVRTDENMVELSKRMAKSKAEVTPVPPLTKKSIKKEQIQELSSQLDAYFNSINLQIAFKREKPRVIFLKFVAPVNLRDEGYGSVKGNDVDGWYTSIAGLN